MPTIPGRGDGAEVLIVGAGPTGLVLAVWLTRLGVRVRIVDKADQPGTESRALAVHARTLELYAQVGLAEPVVDRGLPFTGINLWVRGRQRAHVELGAIGRGLTPYPFVVIFPQDEHERLLIAHLAAAGVHVERGVTLVGFEERGDRIVADLRGPGGDLQWEGRYLAGCDGARSRAREVLGVGFPGGTYERVFYVADVALTGPVANGELHVALDDADFFAAFPLAGGNVRLIGTVPLASEQARHDLGWADVSSRAAERMAITVTAVHWFSTYRVHHRVAGHWRRGRAFLLGDAAHVHSPVGGQGMNTGIGDAVNLAWKLAHVLRGEAPPALLDTYELERAAFARRLVATTDRAFTFVTRDGPIARRVRVRLVPRVLPGLTRRPAFRRFLFRNLSQTRIRYRRSPASAGRAGGVHGGDRLPWVEGLDNFAPLRAIAWQVHVYGEPPDAIVAAAERRRIPLHRFPWVPRAQAVGLARDAWYLVRPDGYVGAAGTEVDALERYLDAWRPAAGDVA